MTDNTFYLLAPVFGWSNSKYKTEFDLISTNKAEFLLRRTKSKYYEYGDKASRLIALQLKRQSASRFITKIRKSPQTLTTDPIVLFKTEAPSEISSMKNVLDSLDFPTVTLTTKNNLDAPIHLEEVTASLKSMQNDKAPGPDGFPADFLKKFSDQLAPLLLDMFNDSLEHGCLPLTLTQASISLIPKRNKDPEELNSDVKLLAKILASRLDPCLPSIISSDQTGFIKGRQLSSNIRCLLNVVLSKSDTQDAEMVVSLDAEKAFDCVEWG